MRKKIKEEILARQLRKKGFSLAQISSTLKISKSSASIWVKDVRLTLKQRKSLKHNQISKEVVERRRITRINRESDKRRKIINLHKNSFSKKQFQQNDLQLLGCALYWAEGTKSNKNRMFQFSNSDPEMIKVMMVFLRNICQVPKSRYRGHIHLPPGRDIGIAEKYWSNISNISSNQFYKTTQIKNKSSSNTRDNLPYGTFSVQVCSVDLYLKMIAWIESVQKLILK